MTVQLSDRATFLISMPRFMAAERSKRMRRWREARLSNAPQTMNPAKNSTEKFGETKQLQTNSARSAAAMTRESASVNLRANPSPLFLAQAQ